MVVKVQLILYFYPTCRRGNFTCERLLKNKTYADFPLYITRSLNLEWEKHLKVGEYDVKTCFACATGARGKQFFVRERSLPSRRQSFCRAFHPRWPRTRVRLLRVMCFLIVLSLSGFSFNG
jgi:hypothetical protein